MTDFACSLDAAALAERTALYRDRLASRVLHTSRTEQGLRIGFPDDPAVRADIELLIGLERQCCDFLELALTEHPERGELALTVAGPEGAHDVLAAVEQVFVAGCRTGASGGRLA